MQDLRDDLPEEAVSSCVPQHDEANQLIAIVGTKQIFSGDVPRKLCLDCVEILSIMPKQAALPHRNLIENVGHPPNEAIVVADFPDLNSELLCLSDLISDCWLDLFGQPVVEGRHWESSNHGGLGIEVKVRDRVGNALPETENVNTDSGGA